MTTIAWIVLVLWALGGVLGVVGGVHPLSDRPIPYLIVTLLWEWATVALALTAIL